MNVSEFKVKNGVIPDDLLTYVEKALEAFKADFHYAEEMIKVGRRKKSKA